MLKRILAIITVVITVFSLAACIKTKTLHCDYCNGEFEVPEKSNMEEDWTNYCESCNHELFGDDPLLGTGN